MFPSLNPAKTFSSQFPIKQGQQIVRQLANHVHHNVQRGGNEPIRNGPCQLFRTKINYDIMGSRQRYSRQMGGCFQGP